MSVFMTSHSGDSEAAGLCFDGVVGVVVLAVLVGEFVCMVQVARFVLVPPPTIESIEKPILGLEGTATIGVGARGIIVCVSVLLVLVCFCPFSFFLSVTQKNKCHLLELFTED